MPVTRDDYRLAILGAGVEGWTSLAEPAVRSAESFPELTEEERGELVAGLFRELLARSQIALAPMPEEGKHARPMAPAEGRAVIDRDDWRGEGGDFRVGYVTTRPGAAEFEDADLCWVCDGFVSRLASGQVEFERGDVAGPVPVCDDHLQQSEWPDDAAEAIAGLIVESFGGRPEHRHLH